MSDNRVTQEQNTVLGDQAGRDVIKHNYNIQGGPYSVRAMKRLIEKFDEQQKNDTTLQGYIAELEQYFAPKNGDVLGVEEKLRESAAANFIEYALEAKESYNKKVTKYVLYEAAQEINVHLLALTKTYFEFRIKPRLQGITEQELGHVILEFVINPLWTELDENPLGFTATDLAGMLYFLTGNCHITWKN